MGGWRSGLAALALGLALAPGALAGEPQGRPRDATEGGWANPLSGHYLRGLVEVPAAIGRRLLDTRRRALIADGLFLGAAGGLFLLDEEIADFWQGDVRSEATDDVLDSLEDFGDVPRLAMGLAGGYLVGGVLGQTRFQRTTMYALQSLALASAATEGLKALSGRKRPRETGEAFDFAGPGRDLDSFPSGHATAAWSVATVFAREYDEDTWVVPAVGYTLATAASLQRVNDDSHWASDVFIGTAIGYTVGSLVQAYSETAFAEQVALAPFAVAGGAGVRLEMPF